MSRMTNKPAPTPKPKSPRRSDAEISADYAKRAEAARMREIRKSPTWQRLTAAIEALDNLGVSDEDGTYNVHSTLYQRRREMEKAASAAQAPVAMKQTEIP